MFETNKEILDAFRQIKKFIKDEKNVFEYRSYIGNTMLAKKIWCAFVKLFKTGSISDVGIIIERFYNIKISYYRTDDWEDKMLKLYNICDKQYLEIE
jgi:hypothetical protein